VVRGTRENFISGVFGDVPLQDASRPHDHVAGEKMFA
jgi:hypothetical protein